MPMQNELYRTDFFAWTQAQCRAVRAAASARVNLLIDWEHVVEEIEGLGAHDRRELASRIGAIVEHLLKLHLSPADAPARGWRETVLRNRLEIEQLLEQSPSLRPEVAALVAAETPRMARLVGWLLADFGELWAERRERLEATGYRAEEVLGDWWP